MRQRAATAIGFLAVVMWAFLAALTVATGDVPPFLLTALTFTVGSLVGFAWIAFAGRWCDLKQPLPVWGLGVVGLFGYHALYFAALDHAPAIEASLIAYLWPLLIVLFSGLLPGERLRGAHVAGAVIGFLGAALVVTRGTRLTLDSTYVGGYLAAFLCALVWSGYSLLSRRYGRVPTGIVAGYSAATALLAALAHVATGEPTVFPANASEWVAVLALGLFPVGAAFYCWDHGVKRGDIQLLGVASFAAPLLSAVILVLTGAARPNWTIIAATVLVTAGALIAARPWAQRSVGAEGPES